MENEFYTDEFEQLLKEKADQFRMYPSRRVWHSIYNNFHPSRRWPSFVMSILLLTSLTLIGYLNTGDNGLTQKKYVDTNEQTKPNNSLTNNNTKNQLATNTITKNYPSRVYVSAFEDVITNETDFYTYTIVRNNRPDNYFKTILSNPEVENVITAKSITETTESDLVQNMERYIKTNQIFVDIAALPKTNKSGARNQIVKIPNQDESVNPADEFNIATNTKSNVNKPVAVNKNFNELNKLKVEEKEETTIVLNPVSAENQFTAEEKAWIENYALQNKPARNKWKGKLAYQFYITPAVNYRKLSTQSKGSVTPFANSDINNSISQKPGFGIETGLGLSYSIDKNLQLKAGVQFNYTNYNIDADKTNHPIITTILLNDPNTGYSYAAARTSSTANAYNSLALQPVTLHNRTYQISVPVGFAYKLSSQNNVDWFAGATVQPTYVFGGNAHIISSDLKSYVSDPSSINSWNLNLGFETFMNFKLGSYSLQVGPQVRYQVYSTYRKTVALIEKPYAVGLKLGLTKGF